MNHKNSINYQTSNSIQLYLNSSNADIYLNGSHKSSVTFFFSELLKNDTKIIETNISIVNAQIPISFYIINETNNIININGTVYNFPVGNYNFNSFVNKWINIFSSQWTITLNTTTNKITFSNPSPFTFLTCSIYSILGFTSGNYTGIYNGSVYSLEASYPCNFSGIMRLNIKSSTFNFHNIDTFEKGQSSIIASIPVNSSYNGIIQYINFTNFKCNIKNTSINTIQLDIMDDLNNYINFNNQSWNLTLCFNIIIDKPRIIANSFHSIVLNAFEYE